MGVWRGEVSRKEAEVSFWKGRLHIAKISMSVVSRGSISYISVVNKGKKISTGAVSNGVKISISAVSKSSSSSISVVSRGIKISTSAVSIGSISSIIEVSKGIKISISAASKGSISSIREVFLMDIVQNSHPPSPPPVLNNVRQHSTKTIIPQKFQPLDFQF